MSARKFLIVQALDSFRGLNERLNALTEEEVLAALDLECATRRRRSVIDRLISRAARLNEVRYVCRLKEKHHGYQKEPDPR